MATGAPIEFSPRSASKPSGLGRTGARKTRFPPRPTSRKRCPAARPVDYTQVIGESAGKGRAPIGCSLELSLLAIRSLKQLDERGVPLVDAVSAATRPG